MRAEESDDASLVFEFRLWERPWRGWADANVVYGEQTLSLRASYLSDALGDLLAAVLNIAEGAETATTYWYKEPGGYRWMLERCDDQIQVRVVEKPLTREEGGDPTNGSVVFDVICPLRDSVSAFASGTRALKQRIGSGEYDRRWCLYPFPVEGLAALERWLQEHPKP